MSSCASIDCSSGLRTNCAQKLSFFSVPKDTDLKKKWQNVCKRTLNPRHLLCEKHFRKEDINWKKEIADSSGKILYSEPLKRPYLKKGIVPSIFSWTTSTIDDDKFPVRVQEESEHFMKTGPQVVKKEINVSVANETVTENVLSFNELKSTDKLTVPMSWSRHVLPLGNNEIIAFMQLVCQKKADGDDKIVSCKEIKIYQDMSIRIVIMGRNYSIPDESCKNITSIDDVEKLITFIHSLKVCGGPDRQDVDPSLTANIASRDSANKLRHNNCLLLLKQGSVCKFCKNLKYLCDRKRKRLSQDGGNKRLRLENLSGTQKAIWQKVRKAKNDTERECRRRKIIIEKLRANLKLLGK